MSSKRRQDKFLVIKINSLQREPFTFLIYVHSNKARKMTHNGIKYTVGLQATRIFDALI